MTQNPSSMELAALNYSEMGLRVFPCHSIVQGSCSCGRSLCRNPGKHPATPHGFKDATREPATITSWSWAGRNVAIETGTASGIIVIDCDRKPGIDGRDELAGLETKFGRLPHTREVQTGSGGRHLYFKCPSNASVPSRAEVGGIRGLDVRGDGGYAIAPPSNHASGRPYIWDPDESVPIADAPSWLIRLISRGQGSPAGRSAANDWQLITTARQPEGRRNQTLVSLTGKMLRSSLDPFISQELIYAWNLAYCDPPLTRAEVESVVNRIAHREALRRQGGGR